MYIQRLKCKRWVGKCVLFRELSSVRGSACNTVQYMSETYVVWWENGGGGGVWLWVLSYLASML